jgi:hypothetical protein
MPATPRDSRADDPADPVVVARRFDDDAVPEDLARWCGGDVGYENGVPVIKVPTDLGTEVARRTDWIVRVSGGQFARVTRDDFAARFEPARPDSPA